MHSPQLKRAARWVALFLFALTTPLSQAGMNHGHTHSAASQLSHAQEHRLQHAQAAVARNPDDLGKALALARLRMELATAIADPALSQQIPGLLAPWWNDSNDLELLVVQAAYWQHDHQFDKARQSLQQAFALDPGNIQASLILSAVEAAEGNWDDSRQACAPVLTQQAAWLSAACLGQSASTSKAITQSLQLIRKRPHDGRAEDLWAAGIQKELQQRLNSGDYAPVAAHPPQTRSAAR